LDVPTWRVGRWRVRMRAHTSSQIRNAALLLKTAEPRHPSMHIYKLIECTLVVSRPCSAVAEDSGASAPKHAHIQANQGHPGRSPTMQRITGCAPPAPQKQCSSQPQPVPKATQPKQCPPPRPGLHIATHLKQHSPPQPGLRTALRAAYMVHPTHSAPHAAPPAHLNQCPALPFSISTLP